MILSEISLKNLSDWKMTRFSVDLDGGKLVWCESSKSHLIWKSPELYNQALDSFVVHQGRDLISITFLDLLGWVDYKSAQQKNTVTWGQVVP